MRPALFIQGVHDELGTPDELHRALARFGGPATLAAVHGVDHSLALPAAARRPIEAVLEDVVGRVDAWERATFPG